MCQISDLKICRILITITQFSKNCKLLFWKNKSTHNFQLFLDQISQFLHNLRNKKRGLYFSRTLVPSTFLLFNNGLTHFLEFLEVGLHGREPLHAIDTYNFVLSRSNCFILFSFPPFACLSVLFIWVYAGRGKG